MVHPVPGNRRHEKELDQQVVTIEITKYGTRHWAVFVDGQLLCVTVYKKGALAVRDALLHQPDRNRLCQSGADCKPTNIDSRTPSAICDELRDCGVSDSPPPTKAI